jgi:transposase-like protein
MSADLQNPIFNDETAAREHLEAIRWPEGPICPHCGNSDPDRLAKVEGEKQSHRPGLYYCNECKGQFTVTVGTVFERSKIPLCKWWLAMHLMAASKKGMSAHQMHRMLGVSYKSTWFMLHRIREAMRNGKPGGMGGAGHSVQADETYYGNTSKRAKGYKKGHRHKSGVVALVNPATGEARAFAVKGATAEKITHILRTNVHRGSTLVTDESRLYPAVAEEYADHQTVLHYGNEYVNKDGYTTNNVENFFGIFKKGMVGTYHFCGEQHLQRYLDEFSFRYTNRSGVGVGDVARAELIAKGAEGKRLTYRRPH